MTKFEYDDPFNRLTLVERPDGGRTTHAYLDKHPCGALVETRTLLDAAGRETYSYQFSDALGRPYIAQILENPGATDRYLRVDTSYDVMGRASLVSKPYRSTGCYEVANPSRRWTKSDYDGLGRVTKVTTPDGAEMTMAYDGGRVTVTDQAGRKRSSVSDSLGRLTQVAEDPTPGGLNYLTNYTYDTLGNLRRVEQGGQSRFFLYDSLGRLIRARSPEQATLDRLDHPDSLTGNSRWSLAYGYDDNGNLTSRVDARNVQAAYAYDGLNRNIITTYTGGGDSTPDVRRFYDDAAGGKGLLWRSEAVGVAATKVISYDAAGRPTEQRQSYWMNNGWGREYSVRRTYDLAGNVLTQTYPSDHTITYNYDAAGRLGDNGSQPAFTGNLGDGVQRTYASGVTYDETGGLREERFGTRVPLYHKLHYNVRGQLYDVRLSTVPWATDQWEWNRGALVNYYDGGCQWQASDSQNNGNLRCSEHAVPLDPNATYTPGAAGAYATSFQTYAYDALNRLRLDLLNSH